MRQQQNSVRLRSDFAAALTPIDEDLNVDTGAFAVHCQRLLDAGCHGLGVFGTTGEANSLPWRANLRPRSARGIGYSRRQAPSRNRLVRPDRGR